MTDTVTIPRAMLEQALEALEKAHHAMQSDMSQDQVGEAVAALRSALEQPQQDQRACGGRNCGSLDPRYHSRECFTDQQPQAIDHYEAALKAAFPEGAQGAAYEHWNEARRLQQDTALLRHCLELIEGEWLADDPAAGPLMVKLRQRLEVTP